MSAFIIIIINFLKISRQTKIIKGNNRLLMISSNLIVESNTDKKTKYLKRIVSLILLK